MTGALMGVAVALASGARPVSAAVGAAPNPAIVGDWIAFLETPGTGASAADRSTGPQVAAHRREDRVPGSRGNPAKVGGWTRSRVAERVAGGIYQPAPRPAGESLSGSAEEAAATAPSTGTTTELTTAPPAAASAAVVSQHLLYFDSAVAVSRAGSAAELEAVGEALMRSPRTTLEVAGHADSRGSDAFNDLLARARAQGVLDALVEKFPAIAPERVTLVGHGESRPIASNGTASGRGRNRRVELTVLRPQLVKK